MALLPDALRVSLVLMPALTACGSNIATPTSAGSTGAPDLESSSSDGADSTGTESPEESPESPECGDGQVQADEACDDGRNGNQDDGCTDACEVPVCGDGIVQPSLGETCDDAGRSDTCTAMCNTKQWSAATLLEQQTGETWAPDIAVDGEGNAIATWEHYEQGAWQIYVRHYQVQADSWGEPIRLEIVDFEAPQTGSEPRVKIDGQGNALVVWTQSDSVGRNIWAARYTEEANWSSPIPLAADLSYAGYPSLAMNAAGEAAVAWGTAEEIQAQRFTPATGWVGAVPLDVSDGFDPHVGIDQEGNVIVAWIHDQPRASRYDALSQQWSSMALPWQPTGRPRGLTMAMNSAGVAVTAWSETVQPLSILIASIYHPGQGWEDPQILRDGGLQASAAAAIDSGGNMAVIWADLRGEPGVYSASYESQNQAWTPATLLREQIPQGIGVGASPTLAMGESGDVIFVWGHQDQVLMEASHYNVLSGTWGPEAILEQRKEKGFAHAPRLAIHDDLAFAVWHQNGDTYYATYR